MQVQELFGAKPMTASGVVIGVNGGALGGFLCTVAGSIKLTVGVDGLGTTIVDTLPVSAGTYIPLPLALMTAAYATLTGGAQGTFFIL